MNDAIAQRDGHPHLIFVVRGLNESTSYITEEGEKPRFQVPVLIDAGERFLQGDRQLYAPYLRACIKLAVARAEVLQDNPDVMRSYVFEPMSRREEMKIPGEDKLDEEHLAKLYAQLTELEAENAKVNEEVAALRLAVDAGRKIIRDKDKCIGELEKAARLHESNVRALLSLARHECVRAAGLTNVRCVEETGEALRRVLGDAEVLGDD